MHGDYPDTMKIIPGGSLPVFSDADKELVKGTFDYIAMNYYTVVMVKDNPLSLKLNANFQDYMEATWICMSCLFYFTLVSLICSSVQPDS